MITKTLVIAAVVIAATAALAIAPLGASVMAARGGSQPQGDVTVNQCTHNGNGATTPGTNCGPGQSSQDTSFTLEKCRGKYYTPEDNPCP